MDTFQSYIYIDVYLYIFIPISLGFQRSGRFQRIRRRRRRASPGGCGAAARRPGRAGSARQRAVPRGAAAGGATAAEAGDVRDALCLAGSVLDPRISWENYGNISENHGTSINGGLWETQPS